MRKYLDAYVTHDTKNMTKEEWLWARGAGIGGSDASSVLGFSPYRSSISVYLEKVHYVNLAKGLEDKDIYESLDAVNEGSYKMELSKKLEDFVAREFSLITGKKVRNVNGILKNDKYPFALANINKAVVGEKAFLLCRLLIAILRNNGKRKCLFIIKFRWFIIWLLQVQVIVMLLVL